VFKVPNKLSGVSMRELIAAVAGPRQVTDTRDTWLMRAARLAGTSYRQARAIYYGEINDPYHRSVSKFREAAGKHEARNLAAQFESLAHSLNVRDADFHCADRDALLVAARALRGLDRTGTDGT
jgi:hypothetical protein